MVKTLWQKIDRKIGCLKFFRNSATLILNHINTNPVTGSTTGTTEEYAIRCPAPGKVSDGMIDNTLVYSGDSQIVIDYLTLREICNGITPPVEWNETSAFLQAGIDEFRFGGVTYSIRSIIAQDWQNDQPGQYLLILQGVAQEA